MRFVDTVLRGVYLVEPDPITDDRGFFARTLDAIVFERHGLTVPACQWSVSFNARKGTVRGLHYQVAPHEEVKLVTCTMGAAYDVLVDLRDPTASPPTWIALELTALNRRAVYIPGGVAHGYQTLEDDTQLSYYMSTPYVASASRVLRWDDPALAIPWPVQEVTISERDRTAPLWSAGVVP